MTPENPVKPEAKSKFYERGIFKWYAIGASIVAPFSFILKVISGARDLVAGAPSTHYLQIFLRAIFYSVIAVGIYGFAVIMAAVPFKLLGLKTSGDPTFLVTTLILAIVLIPPTLSVVNRLEGIFQFDLFLWGFGCLFIVSLPIFARLSPGIRKKYTN
jgi:hypothetical protein